MINRGRFCNRRDTNVVAQSNLSERQFYPSKLMKNLLLALLLVATLTLAGLYAHERTRSQRAQADIKALNEALVDLQTRVDEQEQQTASLQKHLQSTRQTAIAKADEVTQLQHVIT